MASITSSRSSMFVLSLFVLIGLISAAVIGIFFRAELIDPYGALAQATLLLAGATSAIASLIFCRHWIKELTPDIAFIAFASGEAVEAPEEWFRRNRCFFGLTFGNLGAATSVAILATVAYFFMSFVQSDNIAVLVLGYSIVFLCSFVAGSALYVLARGIRFFDAFGRKFEFYLSDNKFGILLVGRVLMKCYILIVMTVALFMATPFIGSSDTPDIIASLTSWPMWLLGYPVGIFLFTSFVFAQTAMHRKLKRLKKVKIRELEHKIAEMTPADRSYDDKTIASLSFLRSELQRTLDMPEWPCRIRGFSGGGVISLLGMVFPPLLQSAFQLLQNGPVGA